MVRLKVFSQSMRENVVNDENNSLGHNKLKFSNGSRQKLSTVCFKKAVQIDTLV